MMRQQRGSKVFSQRVLSHLTGLVFALCLSSEAVSQQPAQRPNIVLIMADDMGYGDAGCYNADSKIPTPGIDRLAREGMRFTDAHSPAAVCVPTRYGLLTGRYPFRNNRPERNQSVIEPGRMTLASLLTKNGYATTGLGKWHLGFDGGKKRKDYAAPIEGGPTDRGFEHFFGIPASLDIPPYYWFEDGRCVAAPSEHVEDSNSPGWTRIQGAFWRAGGIAPGYRHIDVLPELRKRAIKHLRTRAEPAAARPFFLYLALPAPHTPWLPTKAFRGRSKAAEYGDFVCQVDDLVAGILSTLDDLGLAANTLIIFTSDNGPVWYEQDVQRLKHRSVGPLRGMKGDAWEGGHRMPFLVRWPGEVEPGSTSAQTICHTDLLATFADILDVDLPEDAGEDSFSILPALTDPQATESVRDALVSQSSGRVLSIRQGRWKLIPQLGSGGFSKPRRTKPVEDGPRGQLYDLQADLGEQHNLWKDHPNIVGRLTALLERYRKAGRSR